jgi:uncharacterized protein involved in exopolysaccharide biosynthesis
VNAHNDFPRQADMPTLEIDLLVYLRALLAKWWLIVGAAVLLALLAGGYSFTLPNKYEAVARTALVDVSDPGGVNPDERRAPEVLTLVEHGFVLGKTRDNQLEVTLARLRSRKFTLAFMDRYNVWAQLNPEHWDAETGTWIDGFTPDRGAGHKLFREHVRFIDHDEETDIIGVRFRWTDERLVRDWANAYVDLFNEYMREQALSEVDAKQAFLEEELQRRSVVDIQQSIYRLMEAQTAIAMLARSRDEFALEYIDPAVQPYDRFSPARKKWVVLGGFTGAMLATFFIIATVVVGRLRELLVEDKS